MKKVNYFVFLLLILMIYTISSTSADSVTFSYKVKKGDKREYTYTISKAMGVDTDDKGQTDTIKITEISTSQTLFGSITTPKMEYQFWNGTVLTDQVSSLFLVRVPSDLSKATIDDYEKQYGNLWPMTSSNDMMNVSVVGSQITLLVYLVNFENITAIYDLNTGWAKSIYSILYMSMYNQTLSFMN